MKEAGGDRSSWQLKRRWAGGNDGRERREVVVGGRKGRKGSYRGCGDGGFRLLVEGGVD